MEITFLGATKTVTGSNFLLEGAGKKILVDCGLYQGKALEEREKAKKPTERSSYGRLLVGEEKECRAVIDISYVVKPIPAIQ